MLKSELLFLESTEIACLAGRKTKKTQIEALRRMGVHFFVNANGAPVVPRPQFLGQHVEVTPAWKPRVLQSK